MIKELSKDLIGKTIYAYPTGDNVSRALVRANKPQVLIEFEVISVGRKYMELKRPAYTFTDRYNLSGATQKDVQSGYSTNAGYHFFLSLEDVEIWKDKREKRSEVETYFRSFKKPTDEQILKIHAILFENEGE